MSAKVEPILVSLADVKPEEVRWLWKNRVPLCKVTLIVGDPGLGKSFVALDIAADVSRSGKDVILLSAEDDPADTIRPRLDVAGADVSRVQLLRAIRTTAEDGKDTEAMVRLDHDIRQIAEAINQHPNTALIVIDPLSAYMGNVDSRSDEQVRTILAPLAQLASKAGVAIVCVKHLNKDEQKSAMYRAGGSIGFVAAARVVWMIVKDKDHADRRLMLLVKSNIGSNPGGLAFRIEETDSKVGLKWDSEPVHIELEDALRADVFEQESALDEAKQFLKDKLANGPVPASEVQQAAKEADVSDATLRRAGDALKIKSKREGFGAKGRFRWSLPAIDAQVPEQRVEHLCGANGEMTGETADSADGQAIATGPPAGTAIVKPHRVSDF